MSEPSPMVGAALGESSPGRARFRFTIARGMVAVAALAPVLALAWVAPYLVGYLGFLAASVGAGWGTWRVCRRRPGLALRLHGVLLLLSVVLAVLIGLRPGLLGSPYLFVAWVVLIAPLVTGSAVAWFKAVTPEVRPGDTGADMIMTLMFVFSLLFAVPVHLVTLFAAIVIPWISN